MEADVYKQLQEQQELLETIQVSVEKTRKYILTSLIITIVVMVLPLIGLVFVIPTFLSTYSQMMNI